MVFNAIFNNISVKLWWSVLLVEETGVSRENHRPVTSNWQTLSHNIVSSTHCHEQGSNSVVTGTDYTGSCKLNYHTITTTTALKKIIICIKEKLSYSQTLVIQEKDDLSDIEITRLDCISILSVVSSFIVFISIVYSYSYYTWLKIKIIM